MMPAAFATAGARDLRCYVPAATRFGALSEQHWTRLAWPLCLMLVVPWWTRSFLGIGRFPPTFPSCLRYLLVSSAWPYGLLTHHGVVVFQPSSLTCFARLSLWSVGVRSSGNRGGVLCVLASTCCCFRLSLLSVGAFVCNAGRSCFCSFTLLDAVLLALFTAG